VRFHSLVIAVPAKFYMPGESAGTTAYFAEDLTDIYSRQPCMSICFRKTPAILCKRLYLLANPEQLINLFRMES